MAPARTLNEPPTDVMIAADIRAAAPEKSAGFWRRTSPTMLLCLLAMTVFAVTLAGLGLCRGLTGRPAVGWLIGAGGLLMCSFQAVLFAGFRDWADQRNRDNVAAMRAHVQCETYRLEQGQAKISKEMSDMRTEVFALLRALPAGVIHYGDARDEEGEARAVRRFTAASGTEGRQPPGIALVHSIDRR